MYRRNSNMGDAWSDVLWGVVSPVGAVIRYPFYGSNPQVGSVILSPGMAAGEYAVDGAISGVKTTAINTLLLFGIVGLIAYKVVQKL